VSTSVGGGCSDIVRDLSASLHATAVPTGSDRRRYALMICYRNGE